MDDWKRLTTLVTMPRRHVGFVVEIRGGRAMTARLDSMGIRPGKRIFKLNNMLMRGPVMVEVDRAQVSVGFGAASRIIVSLCEADIEADTVDGKP